MRAIIVFLFCCQSVSAETCSNYERAVFKLVDEAKLFQETQKFKEYGWSKAGPTNGWLNKFQKIRDAEKDLEFFRKYDFFVADVYQVADEFRTNAELDEFYKDMLNTINKVKRCK